MKWNVDSAGRIFVETKEDLKDRGLPSPDHADAAILSTVNTVNMYMPNVDTTGLTGDLLDKAM